MLSTLRTLSCWVINNRNGWRHNFNSEQIWNRSLACSDSLKWIINIYNPCWMSIYSTNTWERTIFGSTVHTTCSRCFLYKITELLYRMSHRLVLNFDFNFWLFWLHTRTGSKRNSDFGNFFQHLKKLLNFWDAVNIKVAKSKFDPFYCKSSVFCCWILENNQPYKE